MLGFYLDCVIIFIQSSHFNILFNSFFCDADNQQLCLPVQSSEYNYPPRGIQLVTTQHVSWPWQTTHPEASCSRSWVVQPAHPILDL